MPSFLHEALLSLFQSNPGLAAQLLRDVLSVELPRYSEVRVESGNFSDFDPAEYRADLVTTLVDEAPVFSIIVEVQLAEVEQKRRTWLAYTAGMMRRLKCDACVFVVTPNEKVARWAAQPLRFGLMSTFQPIVLGPSVIPVITDPQQAAQTPELSLLSVLAHGSKDVETAVQVAAAARDAVRPLPDSVVYFDLIKSALSDAARKVFEMLPATYEFQDEALRRSNLAGKARGKAEAVLKLLAKRGVAVSDPQRERILACTDLDVLERWFDAAFSVANTDELFA